MDSSNAQQTSELKTVKRITICCYCRKRIHRQRNGEWYHDHNASTACRPGDCNPDRQASPVEVGRVDA